ncbi:MAG: response regulator [Lachnospiraceae bacterium]|nr:response regulator [Lachnospiraceae bacterium]
MKKNRKNAGIVIAVAVMLIVITIMNTLLVFRMTSDQTRDSGIYRLMAISGELKSTINDAEKYTMELALKAGELIDDKAALEAFIFNEKAEIDRGRRGCFNLYIAGDGWDIIPDFDDRKDFVATERGWYKGAVRKNGTTYVTSPYIDVVTGNICYTISVMLGDCDTVIGVDYTMESIRNHLSVMFDSGSEKAIVVTEDGIVAGSWDDSMVGKRLVEVLPEYAGIFSLAKSKDGVVSSRIKDNIFYENLFATGTGSGWFLIVSENDWEMYGDAYMQMLFTLILSLALMGVIIILYIYVIRNQTRAEQAFETKEEFISEITGELSEPLNRILELSGKDMIAQSDNYEAEFAKIHSSGEQLSEMIGQMMSYSSIVKTEKKKEKNDAGMVRGGVSRRFRSIIVIFMVLVMLVSLYSNVSATYRWGRIQMRSDMESFEYPLSKWIDKQKSILDMFCSIISSNPDMLKDYEGTISYLNDITMQYPEISASYMTSPNLTPTVYMNNGWQPDAGWHLEERQWYIDTSAAESGWSISAPYNDSKTGVYCVTFSKRVYSAVSGELLGIFGIDFYMDKLVDILGSSYSSEGYAFLVDADGYIINHPYGSYQMTLNQQTNVSDLPYGQLAVNGANTLLFKDYDNTIRILIATRNEASDFTVYVVSGFWKIYGKVVIYGLMCLIMFTACIILVYKLLTELIRKQEEYSRSMKEAADAAIAAGKAKSQFLAQMSHEIRTPINAVLGMNEMILREADENNILEYSNNIQSAGRTLLSLINSILDFSKIEDGKMEILPVKYETATLVSGLVNSIFGRAKEKGLEFITEIDESIPSVLLGDDVRVSQVVMNLLTNAVKYTEKGSVTFRMRNAGTEGNSVVLAVEVEDTGIGIRKEDIRRMFESFERLDEKRNRNIEGTGLGMSIVTKLLAMMNSELSVNSIYGEGSVFSFRIKQQIIDASPMGRYSERQAEMIREQDSERYLYASGVRVLVVDDNAMNLKVAKNLLKLCNIVPDMVKSGYEAIDILKQKKYDIIFLDHMMPKLDGIETLNIMRGEDLVGDAKVIALTANAVEGVRDEYISAGFDDYLSKPIELHTLEKMLIRYLPEGTAVYRAKRKKRCKSADDSERCVMNAVRAADNIDLADDEYLEFLPEGDEEDSDGNSGEQAVSGESKDKNAAHGDVSDADKAESAGHGAASGTGKAENTGHGAAGGIDKAESTVTGMNSDNSNALDIMHGTGNVTSETMTSETGNAASEADNVEFEDAPESDTESAAWSDRLAEMLNAAGVDIKTGLLYCADDEDIYASILMEYAGLGPQYTEELNRYIAESNLKDYAIVAHAIKSSSKTIGAMELSEEAKALEMAAKSGDEAFVKEKHAAFVEKYSGLTEMIRSNF